MSLLEVALAVFIFGAVVSGALLTLMGVAWISAHTELIRARTASEKRFH